MELVTGVESYLSSGLLPAYYFVVILGAVIVLFKFRFNLVAVFIVLIFIEGFFFYISESYSYIKDAYKIGYLLFAIGLFGNKLLIVKKTGPEKILLLIFLFIGISYYISFYINESNLLTSLSQYLKKYGIPVLFYFGIKYQSTSENRMNLFAKLFMWLLGLQIVFNLFKLLLFGFGESLVGSISFLGGAPSNIIPILGFLLVWTRKEGVLKSRDWIFVLLLLMSMAIIGNKRSVWFIMPLIVGSIYVFVQKKVKLKAFIRYSILLVVIFVVGVKSNPTLNPDGSRWGRFDLGYLFEYAFGYTFGNEELNARNDTGHGRGGGFLEFTTIVASSFSTNEYLFGSGVEEVVIKSYEEFDNEKYGVQSKGSAGAFVQNFITNGIIGTLLIFLFGLVLTRTIKNKPLRRVLYAFLIWDYILFYNLTISVNAHAILYIFIIVYHNMLSDHINNIQIIEKRKNESEYKSIIN